MNFSMALRSRRSKSRTPVRQTFFDDQQSEKLENHVAESKTITKVVNVKTTYTSEIIENEKNDLDYNKNGWYKVDKSQYTSSFLGDDEVTSTNMTSQNIINQSFENSRNSFNNSDSSVSALDLYRAAGDYWNKYPKTDYTYSLHSKDRKEIAPGVIAMPNMSRRSLRNFENSMYSNKQNTSRSMLLDEVDYSTKENTFATKQSNALFSNSYKQHRSSNNSLWRKVVTAVKNVVVTILTFFYVIYKIQNSICVWMGMKIHKAATRLLLFDTWVLQSGVKGKNKLNWILALCFVPLLLFGGWWLYYGIKPAIFGADYASKTPVQIQDHELPLSINTMHKPTVSTMSHNIAAGLTSEQVTEITKLLENLDIQEILNNNKHISFEDESHIKEVHLKKIEELAKNIFQVKLQLEALENNKNKELGILAAQFRMENAEKIEQLTYQLNRCCRSSQIQIENHVIKILKNLLSAPNYLATPQDVSKWLHSTFVAKNDLEAQLHNLTHHLHSDYSKLIEDNGKLIMETVTAKVMFELNSRIEKTVRTDIVGEITVDSLTDEYVKKIVQNALAVYDADKTGLVDYALESAGGQILSTRCTESYHARTAVFSLFGIPLWYLGNTPRTVIMPGVTPGECWAFQNFPGFVVIKLAAPIKIEAFSLEHISKMLAPNGKIDSAPKEFSVYGLRNETDREPILLGQYRYDLKGLPLQYFSVQTLGLVFDIVELRIHSNNGNPNYTCLYRFRVHGILSNGPT